MVPNAQKPVSRGKKKNMHIYAYILKICCLKKKKSKLKESMAEQHKNVYVAKWETADTISCVDLESYLNYTEAKMLHFPSCHTHSTPLELRTYTIYSLYMCVGSGKQS